MNLLNNTDANQKNRWICTTPKEISVFKKTMLAVSAMTLLALFLLYFFNDIFIFLYSELIIIISNSDKETVGRLPNLLITEELVMLARNIASILISAFSFILSSLFFMFIITGGEKDKDSYISLRPKLPKNTVILIFVGLSIVYFFTYISALFEGTLNFLFGIQKYGNNFYSFPQTVGGIIIYFISVVVTPALFEEFVFRYLALNALQKYGNAFAIVVSSVLFGFIHASTNAFFFATALGMFSAYIAIKTKSICFSVILHAVVNSTAMVMEYLGGALSEQAYYLFNLIYLDVILAVSVISIFVFIKKKKKIELMENKNHVYIKGRTKLLGFWNVLSIIFFLVVIWISISDYYFQVSDVF